MERGMFSVRAVCGFCFFTVPESNRGGAVCKSIIYGNRIEPEMICAFDPSMQQNPTRIYDEKDHFIGIYEFQQERGNFKPVKVFMEE